jgi:hypothetical protein
VAVAVCCVALLASTPTRVVLRQNGDKESAAASQEDLRAVIHQDNLSGNYQSASEAQLDLSSYFDKQQTHFKVTPSLSATEALRQADSIFASKAPLRSARVGLKERQEVTQDLAFSSADSKNDMNSYFNSLEAPSKKIHHATQSSGSSAKYINAKRAALNDGDDFEAINADGSRSQMKDKWSSANAAKELDRFQSSATAARHGRICGYAEQGPGGLHGWALQPPHGWLHTTSSGCWTISAFYCTQSARLSRPSYVSARFPHYRGGGPRCRSLTPPLGWRQLLRR